MNPRLKQILIVTGIGAVIVWLWYYLKGSGVPLQVSSPNAEAGGLPAYKSADVANFFGASQPAPSPALIYNDPPPLPPTPDYQRYNYSPLSIFNLTPEAAAAAQPGPTDTKKHWAAQAAAINAIPGVDPCCGSGGGCGCPGGGPVFQDANLQTRVAANPSEQISAAPDPTIYAKLQFNLSTSPASNDNATWGLIGNAISVYQVEHGGAL